jgi:ribosomal protein L37E
MAELVADCPRCGSRHITFDVLSANPYRVAHGWQNWYEAFGICRRCGRTAIFVPSESVDADYQYVHKVGLLKVDGALNRFVKIEGHISLKDTASVAPPEFLPADIESSFREGATCLAVGCYNAAATMFRLCVDLATRSMLPADDAPGLNAKTRRDLGLRFAMAFHDGSASRVVERPVHLHQGRWERRRACR